MEDEQRLAIMEAVAQGVIQGLNGNENRLFGNGQSDLTASPRRTIQIGPNGKRTFTELAEPTDGLSCKVCKLCLCA